MTVLAVLNRAETAQAVLRAAAALHRLYDEGDLLVLRPRPDVDPDFMPTEEIMSPGRRAAFEADEDRLTSALRRVLGEAMPDGPALTERRGTVRTLVAKAARTASVAVVGALGHAGGSLARDAIEAVLFDAAAPLLLLPERSAPLGDRVVAVAWEQSEAAEQAVSAALPILLAAERVVVLVAEEGNRSASLPEGLLAALDGRARPAEVRRFALGGRNVGTAILDEARAAGAGLLVLGAFTHPRLLERLFGGATQEILEGARLPLLLHH